MNHDAEAVRNGPPLVTVIVPAYNSAPWIEASIKSILDQGYPALEVIVVDDESTDETREILARFGDRIRVISQKRGGPAGARNRGLDLAAGKYVTFLDADDLWFPGKLERQVDYLERHPDVGAVYASWSIWKCNEEELAVPDDSQVPGEDLGWPSGWIYHALLLDNYVSTIVVMIRRSIADEVGRFDVAYPIGEDYGYWIRLSRVTEIRRLNRTLAVYRHHGRNTTYRVHDRNYESMVVEDALARWGTAGPDGTEVDAKALRLRRAGLRYRFGHEQFHAGHYRHAALSFLSALRFRPLWPGCWFRIVRSIVRGVLAPFNRSGRAAP